MAGKFKTGNTFPKQYWLAVNGKPKILDSTAQWVLETYSHLTSIKISF